jgi:hypothetical protein
MRSLHLEYRCGAYPQAATQQIARQTALVVPACTESLQSVALLEATTMIYVGRAGRLPSALASSNWDRRTDTG